MIKTRKVEKRKRKEKKMKRERKIKKGSGKGEDEDKGEQEKEKRRIYGSYRKRVGWEEKVGKRKEGNEERKSKRRGR